MGWVAAPNRALFRGAKFTASGLDGQPSSFCRGGTPRHRSATQWLSCAYLRGNSSREAHPYTWAPFVVVGLQRPQPLAVPARSEAALPQRLWAPPMSAIADEHDTQERHQDLDGASQNHAAEAFAGAVENADVALFYYAGHGMQHQGINYLMPIDANLQSPSGLRRLTRLDDVVTDVKRARTLRIMVLDACRHNPLVDVLETATSAAPRGVRSVGLAKIARSSGGDAGNTVAARGGDITIFAAEAGRTAADGLGRNSPFSAAFVRNLETEGQEIVTLVRRVALSVKQETNGEQRPELSLAVPFEFTSSPARRNRHRPCSNSCPVLSRTRSERLKASSTP
jgi:Caspase domain